MGRKSIRRATAVAALALAPALVGATAPPPSPTPAVIKIGAAYIAKQMCSCLFVAQRSEASCRAEFKPEIDNFAVVAERAGLPARARVTARLSAIVAEAAYSRRYGCMITK